MTTTDDKYVVVISKNQTGRNILFSDPKSMRIMDLSEFVNYIKLGLYHGYHIRVINGVNTPCSNPDEYIENNLG